MSSEEAMPILMDEVIDMLRQIPRERQDEIARAVLRLVSSAQPVAAAPSAETNERGAPDVDVAWPEFASNAEMQALWNK